MLRRISKILFLPALIAVVWLTTRGSAAVVSSTGYLQLSSKGQVYHVFKVDLTTDSIAFYWLDTLGQPLQTFQKLQSQTNQKYRFITNGGMFHSDHSPVGLYVENGLQLRTIDTSKASGNFYLKPNGVFGMNGAKAWIGSTERYMSEYPTFRFGTQSGPMLVIDNQIHSVFNEGSQNKYVRSGVGVDSSGVVVFVLSEAPVNFFDFATLFRNELHCSNALYLDGAISGMYCPEANLNSETDFGCMIAVLKRN